MPIHDQTYRRYDGPRAPLGSAWSVIAAAGLRALIRKKRFLLVMFFAWIPFVVQAGRLYLWANGPQVEMFAPSPEMFRQFFEHQSFFVLVVTIYVGAGLIARDRRAHALQLYLSKPLTRAEYVAGKLSILLVVLLMVTWVPAMGLLTLQVAFAGELSFVREHLFLIPAMTVFGLVYALLASFTMLALSSLSTSARFVAVLYTGAVLFTEAMANVLKAVLGHSGWSWLSFRANLAQVGDVVFRMSPRYDTPWAVSLLFVVAVILGSVCVLARRVRGVEVVT